MYHQKKGKHCFTLTLLTLLVFAAYRAIQSVPTAQIDPSRPTLHTPLPRLHYGDSEPYCGVWLR